MFVKCALPMQQAAEAKYQMHSPLIANLLARRVVPVTGRHKSVNCPLTNFYVEGRNWPTADFA
jgi:hypothetical protein